jgi:hypothetical protein
MDGIIKAITLMLRASTKSGGRRDDQRGYLQDQAEAQ